jgi:hypothetical protein
LSFTDCREAEKQCKESDRSSNISDLKMELRTGSSVSNVHCELEYGPDSETGSESVVTRIGVPLAGPVPMPVNGGEHIYRYSAEFTDPVFPPKVSNKCQHYIFIASHTSLRHHLTEHRGQVVNISASYLGGPRLKSRPGDKLS